MAAEALSAGHLEQCNVVDYIACDEFYLPVTALGTDFLAPDDVMVGDRMAGLADYEGGSVVLLAQSAGR